jgi:hypothetical protein
MGDSGDKSAPRPSNKVARLIEAYDLGEELGDRLEDSWTSDGNERMSLRDLADLFNRRLLSEAMEQAGMSTVDGEVANFYRLLTDAEVSSGKRTEAVARLKRNAVDVDQLQRDFVTYQAIRSYLQEYRDATYEQADDADPVDSAIETIQRLRARIRSVTDGTLERLRDTGRISLGSFRLFVDVDVLCEDCGVQYSVMELLDRGGCECEL